ncbi:MAG: sigma-70 family RNA polymerase sigma factor [Spirochaetes bacterium]|nr:sigma-70 family RNA polymerase sigma factor [Spirochaetota bacterium]
MALSNKTGSADSAVGVYDDAVLLAQIDCDAEHGFTLLVKRYTQSVFNLCYSYMGNRTDADDAAQEVFLKIYRHIGGFKKKAKLSTWIYRIAINTCLNALRSRSRRMQHVNSDDVEIASHDKAIDAVETEHRIHTAIAKLPTDYRSIVVLREYEHKDYREIAEILACSIGSVSSRLSRARDMLRRLLSEQEVTL